METAALIILIVVTLILFYGVIAIHDIPYEIACKRDHPQRDAIHVAGWVSLFTLHAIWPFLWIWATLYRKDRGWGFVGSNGQPETEKEAILELQRQLKDLKEEVMSLKEAHLEADALTEEK
jgi:hypothetical protein